MHNLMGHMHLHSDSKPFKCLYCPSKFTLKGNLTRHMKVKHGVMDRGLDERCKNMNYLLHEDIFIHTCFNLIVLWFSVFRQRGQFCLTSPMGLLTHYSQEEPFDLSQKPPELPSLRLSQSDGESILGSSCQEEEDEESLYRRSQYSPEVDPHQCRGKEQYHQKLEEGEPGSLDDQSVGEKHKQLHQQSVTDEMAAGKAEGRSAEHFMESEESYESYLELGQQSYHEPGSSHSYAYDSDSELENYHQEQKEPEQSEQQLNDFRETVINEQRESRTDWRQVK